MSTCATSVASPRVTAKVPVKENVCAVVVTYFPKSDLLARLRRIRPQVAQVVVVDNGSSHEPDNCLSSIETEMDAHIVRNSVNLGIAAALNQGAYQAANMGYEWFLALDQDTLVAPDVIVALSKAYEDYPLRDKLAVIASNYIDVISGHQLLPPDNTDRSWQQVPMAITSGCLFSLSAFGVVGSFREEFFMDSVDFDYCLRASARGFKIIVARGATTEHPIGAATLHKLPLKKHKVLTTNHPPIRRYYMTRNQVVLAREYLLSQTATTGEMLYAHLRAFLLMALFEKQVARKLRFMAIGLWDGLFGNFHRKLT